MTADQNYHRIQRIFIAALDLDADERTAFLDRECRDDPDLRREVDKLLALEASAADGFLGEPAVARLATDHPVEIGPYTDLQPIGEGGFADVYAATQTGPLQRRVALKLLKPGLDSRLVLRRFAEERQTLARLDHPHIARVYDAGTTGAGRPYFVMELVDGEPIDRYAAHHRLDLPTRLALVRQVCEAVQHAHQKGVIHRDLKPTNILVAEVDGRPVPKVIDFGIAKATAADADGRTLLTEQGQFVGTPEFMSPEQADLGGPAVDTRTDIYSLGVVLYQLLTGDLPISRDTLRDAGIAEMLRLLREEEPARPSERLRRLTASGRRPPTLDGIGSDLARRLRGELDWIVLKALAKEPDRRYASASGLAADLDRYLQDEPVEARPPSRLYRLGKATRRYRVLVGAVAVIMAVLTAALVDSDRRRRQVEAARAESEAVTAFLADALAAADPYDRGREVTVVEVIDAAATSVQEEFADAPIIRARIEDTIGHTLARLGEADRAIPLLESALATQRELLGVRDRTTQNTMSDLAAANRHGGDLERTIALNEELLAVRLADLGPDHVETRKARANRATDLMARDRNDEAEQEFLAALAPGIENPGGDINWIWNTRNSLGNLYAYAGRYGESEVQFELALAGQVEHRGLEHPSTLFTLNNFALLRHDQGREAECDSLLELTANLRGRFSATTTPAPCRPCRTWPASARCGG